MSGTPESTTAPAPGFPALPVLKALKGALPAALRDELRDTTFVCVQHLLATTGSLLQALIDLGADPRRIFVAGKLYSTNDAVADALRAMGVQVLPSTPPAAPGRFAEAFARDVAALWRAALPAIRGAGGKVVVLDDGGRCRAAIPDEVRARYAVVGVEQTTSGLRGTTVPVVDVATSAAKRFLEPQLVSAAVLLRAHALIRGVLGSRAGARLRCGVIGLGHVGAALARDLLRFEHRVVGYDEIPTKSSRLPGASAGTSVREVFAQADVIFGCTGTDVTAGADWIDAVRGEKVLASCSSEDVEFLSVLRRAPQDDVPTSALGRVQLALPGGRLSVVRGGFPVNFDGSPDSVPARDIQLTRGLLLGALAQAALCAGRQGGPGRPATLTLDPWIQQLVVRAWLCDDAGTAGMYGPNVLRQFESPATIAKRSGGEFEACAALTRAVEHAVHQFPAVRPAGARDGDDRRARDPAGPLATRQPGRGRAGGTHRDDHGVALRRAPNVQGTPRPPAPARVGELGPWPLARAWA